MKGLGILPYLLGLSYGAVSLALDALGVYLCKSRVYDAVQAAAEQVPGLKREEVFERIRTPATTVLACLRQLECDYATQTYRRRLHVPLCDRMISANDSATPQI